MSQAQHLTFARRDLPEKKLGYFVLVRRGDLVKTNPTGHSFVAIRCITLVADYLARRLNRVSGKLEFNLDRCPAGNCTFHCERDPKAVQVACKSFLADYRSLLVRVRHAHPQVQARREAITVAQLLALQRKPAHTTHHEQENDGPEDVHCQRPEVEPVQSNLLDADDTHHQRS